jgi:hypothetical protein
MLKKRAVSIALAALLICQFTGCSSCGTPHAQDIKEATAAVDAWLKLLDQGNYGEAWDRTGAQFKKIAAKDAWVKQITPYRGALGAVKSRTLESAVYSDSIPDLQPGEYVLIKYKTSLGNKDLHEEITVQKENDGVWRSLGYYVR